MPLCDKCRKRAVFFVRYSGGHLCSDHLSQFVERRAKHEIRRQVNIKGGERIAVAVSGGKDSIVALELLVKILGRRRDVTICSITVNEGIAGYRESSIPIVAEASRRLGIKHITTSFQDMFGMTVDEIAKSERPLSVCSYCGVLRRSAMNRVAREWGASHLATGLNLDDTAQSILMSFVRGDVERLARLGPHKNPQEGLIPRLQPLRSVPESETTMYALVRKLQFHDLECPYASEALRNQYRSLIFQLEDKTPGTRYSILRSYDEILPMLEGKFKPSSLRTCACGEPTVGEMCKACELVNSLKGSCRT